MKEALFLSSRKQMDKVNKDLSPLERTPGLDSELDKIQALLDYLTEEYKAKKAALENSISPDSTGMTRSHHHSAVLNVINGLHVTLVHNISYSTFQ